MMNKAALWLFLAAACVPAAIAQQEKPAYVQHICVKVTHGQNAVVSALIPDVTALMRARIAAGELEWFAVLRAAIPAGTSARCDYLYAYGYSGFPPAPAGREHNEELFKQAKIKGSYSDMLARRDASTTLVSNDLLRGVSAGLVGPGSPKGGYVRLNLYKVKPGHTLNEWVKLETEGWGPYAAALAKATPGRGWRVETLTMPTGTSQHYNGITVDIFPNWESIGQGNAAVQWSKVHPDLKSADYMAKVGEAVDRYKVELYRVVDVVRK